MNGYASNAGMIRLKTGSIRGRVTFLNPDDLVTAVVAVPEQGIVTQPNAGGGYLLRGVAAGPREVVLLPARYGSAGRRSQPVRVRALETVDGPDFTQHAPSGPLTLDFGLVVVNSTRQLIWKLSNPDGLAATVTSIAVIGRDAAKFQLGVLPDYPIPFGFAGLEVPLTLNANALGPLQADLRVQGEAERVPFTKAVALSAVVTPPPSIPQPDPKIEPAELDFGALSSPSTLPVDLKNEGDASGTLSAAGSQGPFELISPVLPLSLPAHTSRTATVRAVPPGQPGPVAGTLEFICEPGHRLLNLQVRAVWS